uniref:Uncharacterized protein n=1 Tax=Plectus sambesii TaxID=2011161 RepID=A0A914W3X9_9BILA
MKQRAARKRKEEFLTADVRRYERHGNVNDGYDNYPTARIVEVTRTPIYNETDKPASSTTQGMKKHRQKADIVHMRQREFDDTDIINGFEQRRVWNTSEERRGRREPLPEHGLQYEESYRNHHDYPIVPEPDYPTGTDQRRVQLVSTARRHNDNATSLYKIRGTQTSAASLDDNLEGSETRDDRASKRLSM